MLGPTYAATTVGMFALIAFVAFEAMAVTTVMPGIARELDGQGLYALTFAAPLVTGVIGTVAAGMWSDRHGPALPLVLSMVLFSAGLVVCGTAPTMEILVAGRLVQGLGGGALTVGLYVLVGLAFPPQLQPSVFASFAAAWVLPSLFGPVLAAFVAAHLGWRWVFLGAVVLVALSALLIAPAIRGRGDRGAAEDAPLSRLVWASLAAIAVLAVELLGSAEGIFGLGAVVAFVAVVLTVRRLVPQGTLVAHRGLPAVIGTRGLLGAGFFCIEAYIVYVLQEDWGLTAGRAGLALTVVGVTWAAASQAQARLGSRVSNARAMQVGTTLVLTGAVILAVSVSLHLPALVAAGSYVVAGAGMGFGYPRTGVAMLEASTDADRGFNSSALTIADSLGAALALSVAGVIFGIAERTDADPFLAVFLLSVAIGVVGVLVARRTSTGGTAPSVLEDSGHA
ncbi:hypothetical protein ASG90_09630 [Nocardioides sp. Soil797]|nr:hypothetical protein ASG90_09630 [Nocardioides sp. Soil797]